MKHRDDTVPCYKCERRCTTSTYNCHSDCEEYKAYKRAREEKTELISRKRGEEHMMYEVKARGIKKVERKGNKR